MDYSPQSRYILPSYIERTPQGVREYNPYAKLFEERIVFLGVQIDDASADDVMAQLLVLESLDPERDIQMYIQGAGMQGTIGIGQIESRTSGTMNGW